MWEDAKTKIWQTITGTEDLHWCKKVVDNVEGADGAEINDFDRNVVFFFEEIGSGERVEDATAVGDNGEIGAGAFHIGEAEGYENVPLGDFTDVTVEHGVFEEEAGVIIADGGLEEALGIGGGRGDDDLHAGVVGEDVLGCV